MNRRRFMKGASLCGASVLLPHLAHAVAGHDNGGRIEIHTGTVCGKLPHVWEECAGSDRAIVGLRAQWLEDLEIVKKTLGVKQVRFHGLFNDEMGVWPAGAKQPNFLYVDQVFDAMLDRGIRPFVELSFMPANLASGTRSIFFYRGNTTQPKDFVQWGGLIEALGRHCVARYGAAEVRRWNFEVWNEPNIMFWAGTQAEYFELYRQSALALKRVDKALRVGGPSTAQAAWVPDLIAYCDAQQLPMEFASTHIYPDDPQKKVFGDGKFVPFEDVIPQALANLKAQIASSRRPDVLLYITEWSSQNPAFITDTIQRTRGLAEVFSYWTFDNVFEELGVPRSFLNSSFGLLGMHGIPRPSFHTFALLHKLGEELLEVGEGPVLATRRKDGSLAILVWNLIPRDTNVKSSMGDPMTQTAFEEGNKGEARFLTLKLNGGHAHRGARITQVDASNSKFHSTYEKMGSPAYPTEIQISELMQAASLPEGKKTIVNAQGEVTISLPPNDIALVEVG